MNVYVITTSRADYGLLYPVLKELENDNQFQTYLIACGSHLSKHHGNTINHIYEDGFKNVIMIDTDIRSDTENDLCKSIAAGLNRFSNLLTEKNPDFIIVLGDRYELWAFCIAAVIHRVPVVHIHGGESTSGVIDDPVRHSISKMASVHFPVIDQYSKRIIQMGENPRYVFTAGAPGIDNIKKVKLLKKEELEKLLNMNLNDPFALMTYHPVTLDNYMDAENQINEVFSALIDIKIKTIITMPNADTGNSLIYKVIHKYCNQNPNQFKLFKHLGQQKYLSIMNNTTFMIGNSSSGIIESASFKLPVVNIGDRQGGRFKPPNVIDCPCIKESILNAIKKALSKEFINTIRDIKNPYGDGKTAKRIVQTLKKIDFSNPELIKKGFHDILETEKSSKKRESL